MSVGTGQQSGLYMSTPGSFGHQVIVSFQELENCSPNPVLAAVPSLKIVKAEQTGTCTAFSHFMPKVKTITKKDQESPLPKPFELPLNYPHIVMVDLKEHMLTGRARTKFIMSIASAIFRYKVYPTKEEYEHVGQRIVAKYEFLTSKSGNGYVSWCGLL